MKYFHIFRTVQVWKLCPRMLLLLLNISRCSIYISRRITWPLRTSPYANSVIFHLSLSSPHSLRTICLVVLFFTYPLCHLYMLSYATVTLFGGRKQIHHHFAIRLGVKYWLEMLDVQNVFNY